jgi:pimeloyl-ACP methyl ester carboxylesterase
MSAAQTSAQPGRQPTVVLVHGAFADASSWKGVIERLQRQGYSVVAPANPLRGLAADSAYLASVVNQLDGPVLLVGHSYAGALITNTATDAPNVVGLVFVAAFAPDTDERLGDVAATSKDSLLGTAQVQREYPTGPGGETAPEFLVDPARFREVFAADLRRSRPRCWPPPSAPSPPRRSAMCPDRRPGRHFRPGRWSPPPTRPPAATSSVPWPSAPVPRSSRSTPPTWSWSPSRRR